MNRVLEEILQSKQVRDEQGARLPLCANMSEEEGHLISTVFESLKPETSIEIGFAYGISTLFACEALDRNRISSRHIVIDPLQFSEFGGVGLGNIKRAGYERFVDFREAPSEIALPQLLDANTRIQAAIIDGFHTFDHALVDFFYINKMLDVGGAVIFDDVNMPSIARLVSHIAKYPAYRILAGTAIPRSPNPLVSIRRRLRPKGRSPRRSRDNPSCIALEKVAPDARPWDWHVNF